MEGPKLYKRHGYYYIFAPAGGVATGWQLVLRSRNVFGPYEARTVLAQGSTAVNGPHQGAWVTTNTGEDWFLHFQDQGPYGRVVHLQPMSWRDDWPVIGSDPDGDGTGQPVPTYRKPRVKGAAPVLATPATSDEFAGTTLGPQWQWNANPQDYWAYPNGPAGYLRLYSVLPPAEAPNLFTAPNLLLQKLPAEVFTVTTRLQFTPRLEGEKMGLLLMGLDYAYLGISYVGGQLLVSQNTCLNADQGGGETSTVPVAVPAAVGAPLYLRVAVAAGAKCQFSYSVDGVAFSPVGAVFYSPRGQVDWGAGGLVLLPPRQVQRRRQCRRGLVSGGVATAWCHEFPQGSWYN